MNVTSFIRDVLIGEIKLIQADHHYLSFGLISQGIELLGACLDENNDFHTNGESKRRFNNAVSTLFPSQYHRYIDDSQFDLYRNLRCGLLHVALPNSGIELIRNNEIPSIGQHLEVKEIRSKQRIILVAEKLMDDFEEACNKVIKKIEYGELKHKKVTANFLYESISR